MNLNRFTMACALAGALSTCASLRVADAVLVVFDTPLTADPRPAVGNYLRYTFMLVPGPGETVTSFDAKFESATMNQLNPIVGQMTFPTVFEDNNELINAGFAGPTFTDQDDSQIAFESAEFNPLPLVAQESETPGLLRGGGSPAVPQSTTFDLAHIVIPADAMGTWMITTVVNNIPASETMQMGVFGVPEASQVLVGFLATAGLIGAHLVRRFSKRTSAA